MLGRSRSPRGWAARGDFQNDQLLAPCRSTGCLGQGSHTPINMIERILPRRKEMRVKARKHVRNEGSRRFKSAPLRHRVWLLRQSPGNSAKWPPLWPVLSAQPNQRGTNIGVIRRCASVSLRAGTGWFGFAIASAKRRGDLGCRCRGHRADIEMSRPPYGWSNRSIEATTASGSSSPTAGRHAG